MRTRDYSELIAAAEKAATDLQAEIDAAIDEYGVLRRFVDAMRAPADVVQWVPTTVEVAKPEQFATVDAAPTSRDLDVPIEEVRAGLLTATPKAGIKKAKSVAPKRGMDYRPVADWINRAKADGTYTQAAMMAHFNIDLIAVKNWMTRCRNLGLLDGEAKTAKAAAPSPFPEPAPTAAPLASVPERSSMLSGTGNKPLTAARPHVLACTECDFECDTTQGHALNRHCLDQHKRRPFTYERTPVLAVAS